MALQEQKRKNGQTEGPSMAADGLPSNPSDEIFQGRALPIRQAEKQTLRRPFSPELVTKNPLKYLDGPGTDEALCSGRSGYVEGDEHHDYLANTFGQEKPHPPAPSKTTQGQDIRGT